MNWNGSWRKCAASLRVCLPSSQAGRLHEPPRLRLPGHSGGHCHPANAASRPLTLARPAASGKNSAEHAFRKRLSCVRLALGRPRQPVLRPVPRSVPPASRPRLFPGVRIDLAADPRSDRRRRPAARRRVSRSRLRALGRRRVSSAADAAVALAERHVPRRPLLVWHGAVGGDHGRHGAEGGTAGALGRLPRPRRRRTGLPVVPVGRAAAGDRTAGRPVRPGRTPGAARDRRRAERGGTLAGVGPRVQADLYSPASPSCRAAMRPGEA